MRETFAAHQEGLDSPLVTSSYPIPTQTPQTTQVETTDKQPASFDYNAKSIASPRTAEHEKAEALEVETASLPPRCRSAVGSPTSAGSPETDTTAPPLQNRPASSPSTLETAVTVSPSQGSAAPHAPPPLPSSPSSPCHTPSPVSTSPFYTQAYGGYGTLSSPPIMRDDTYPFGYDAPYFGGSRSSSYPPFMPPQPYGPTAEGFLPIGDGPIQLPPGGLMREADLQQQQGIATPGLGLLGMPAPPLSSYVTPPRMTHRKRQSYAGRTGKMSPFEKRHPPVAELGFASPGQQSPVRTFQLPPEVDGSLLEPREWPIVKIENVSRSSRILRSSRQPSIDLGQHFSTGADSVQHNHRPSRILASERRTRSRFSGRPADSPHLAPVSLPLLGDLLKLACKSADCFSLGPPPVRAGALFRTATSSATRKSAQPS